MKYLRSNRLGTSGIALMILVLASVCLFSACRKTEYNVINQAAYLRVFNSINYTSDITTKDLPQPFLAMVIDPVYNASGEITGGDVLGDFLDRRAPYAPPYPDKAGSTDYKNTEYPGSAKVLVGPILNGIDLSSWAQIRSGKHRVVFYTRPVNATPFFELEQRYKQNKLVDSTLDITPGEVYTMEVLQRDANQLGTMGADLYLRKEQFTKQGFSDTLLYVNFYNLSAKGYAAANPGTAPNGLQYYYSTSNTATAIGDEMNIYYSLFTDDAPYPYVRGAVMGNKLIPGFNNIWLGKLIRSHVGNVAPYSAIPMFAGVGNTGKILSKQWEVFTVLAPSLSPVAGALPVDPNTTYGMASANVNFGAIGCGALGNDGKGVETGVQSTIPKAYTLPANKFLATWWLPNLIKFAASGSYAQRSFATISSIEFINNQVYMMSVQRSYPAPNN